MYNVGSIFGGVFNSFSVRFALVKVYQDLPPIFDYLVGVGL